MNDQVQLSARFRRKEIAFRVVSFRVFLRVVIIVVVIVGRVLLFAPVVHPFAMILERGAALEAGRAHGAPDKAFQFSLKALCKSRRGGKIGGQLMGFAPTPLSLLRYKTIDP